MSKGVVHSRFSVCQNILANESMADDLDIVRSAGLGAIALMAPNVMSTGVDETVRMLRERSLVVSSYLAGVPVLMLDSDRADEALRDCITKAHHLDTHVAVVGTGSLAGRTTAEADEHMIACLRRIRGFAADHDVQLALEPLHPLMHSHSYLHSLAHAAELVSEGTGAGIALDLVHTYWNRDLNRALEDFASLVCSVHLGDLDQVALDEKRWERAPLGSGVVPVAELLRPLAQRGFSGYFEYEVPSPADRDESIANLSDAQAWLEGIWDRDLSNGP